MQATENRDGRNLFNRVDGTPAGRPSRGQDGYAAIILGVSAEDSAKMHLPQTTT
jgi:hypothetical protein